MPMGACIPPRKMFDVTEHKMIVANIFLTEVLPMAISCSGCSART